MNQCCQDKVGEIKSTLYKSIGYALPLPIVRDYYLARTNDLFPGALEMVNNKYHQVWAVADSLPIKGTPSPDQLISVEVYDGFISLTGLKKSYDCPVCKQHNHVIFLNCRTLILMQNLLFLSFQSMEDKSDFLHFKKIMSLLFSDTKDSKIYSLFSPILRGEWSMLSEMAFSWLLFHEYAHVLYKPEINEVNIPEVFTDKKTVIEEMSADISALNFLQFRLMANNPLDKTSLNYLFGGVDFFLRTLTVIKAVQSGDLSSRNSTKPNNGKKHPSPYLRIKFINNLLDKEIQLGLCDENYSDWNQNILTNWEKTLNQSTQ